MAWVWMRVRMSVRLGWQDTAQTLGRLIFGLLVAVVATALAIVVFRQPGALLTVFAYPIVVGLTYLFFVARRLAGWNRLWRRESRVVPIPEGRQVQFSLRYKAPIALLQGVTMEISCDLRGPGGREIRGEDVSGHRGQLYKTYHDLYDRTSSLVPGTYWVLWKDRKVPGSGKWRVFDAHRITLPPLPPADAAGPRLPQFGYSVTKAERSLSLTRHQRRILPGDLAALLVRRLGPHRPAARLSAVHPKMPVTTGAPAYRPGHEHAARSPRMAVTARVGITPPVRQPHLPHATLVEHVSDNK